MVCYLFINITIYGSAGENERKIAVRRKATRRDGAFEESLPSSE